MKALINTSFYRLTVISILLYLTYMVGRLLFIIEHQYYLN